MLTLDSKLTLDADTIAAPNLCDRFSHDDLQRIGIYVVEGYKRDKQSRSGWEKRMEAAMKLALQVQEDKNFPWPGASNVKFPLITIGSMQWHSRAYPALISPTDLAKCKVNGEDPEGQKKARADRIAQHMTYQCLEEDQPWEEQHDKGFLNLPIMGCNFYKSYFSPRKGHNVSDLVLAQDLVLNYYAKSVEDCPRKTHVIPLFRNEIYERVKRGSFRDVLDDAWYRGTPPINEDSGQAAHNKIQGTVTPQPDETKPFVTLEQHVDLDLDGDGYEEPYIVTVEESSGETLRIVCRFEEADIERNEANDIVQIRATEYFTKYPFIPNPDGGIYDLGFGILLGPLNESVNTLINQLVDAGTMATTAGGFLGRGVKIRGGVYTFAPLEWKRVDSTGDDLQKNIVPLPIREPSAVLLSLLTLLVNYTNRISGSNDAIAGENPGQNTPAQTEQTMIEQGLKIYSAIFKRVWRAMKEEFKKRYMLNALYLPTETKYGEGGMKRALREDYLGDPTDVSPAADPQVTSDQQRVQQAMAIKQFAMSTPGYDLAAVEINVLQAMRIPAWQTLFKGADKVPPLPNPKMQVEQIKMQIAQLKMKQEQFEFLMKLAQQQKLIDAQIHNLEATAAKALAEAGGVEAGHQIAAFDALIGAARAHDEHLRESIKIALEAMKDADGRGTQDVAQAA